MSDVVENKIRSIKELAYDYLVDSKVCISPTFVMVGLEYEEYMKEWMAVMLYETIDDNDKSCLWHIDNTLAHGKHSKEDKKIVFGFAPTIDGALDDLEEHLRVLLDGLKGKVI